MNPMPDWLLLVCYLTICLAALVLLRLRTIWQRRPALIGPSLPYLRDLLYSEPPEIQKTATGAKLRWPGLILNYDDYSSSPLAIEIITISGEIFVPDRIVRIIFSNEKITALLMYGKILSPTLPPQHEIAAHKLLELGRNANRSSGGADV